MNWIRFIFSYSLFIAVCALSLAFQAAILMDKPVNQFAYLLVFAATLCSYNFYWAIAHWHNAKQFNLRSFFKISLPNILIGFAAGIVVLICVYQLPGVIPFLVPAGILTLAYSVPLWPVKLPVWIQRAGFLKTMLLAFTWTYVTIFIPLHEHVHAGNKSLLLLFSTRFFFMLMLCIIFDSRDARADKIKALHSLATDVSRRSLGIIMMLVFAGFLISGILLRYFYSTDQQMIAFIISGISMLIIYRLSLKDRGYYFYYFLVDGMMLFTALGTFLASI